MSGGSWNEGMNVKLSEDVELIRRTPTVREVITQIARIDGREF